MSEKILTSFSVTQQTVVTLLQGWLVLGIPVSLSVSFETSGSAQKGLMFSDVLLLFIVLFAISCRKQKKSNYLNSHGEEAQKKPPGL